MKLGAFSISLNVKDLKVSKDFYESLGFEIFGGQIEHNYLDVHELYKKIKNKNIETEQESLDGEKGPGNFVIIDPDGNPILIDQHI